MKKLLILAILLIYIIPVSFSQEGTVSSSGLSFISKNGHEVLPQEGEYSIMVGTYTMFRYLGNLFGKTNDNNNIGFFDYPSTLAPDYVIGGRYFLSGNTAIRAAFRINYNNNISKYEVDDDMSTDPDVFLYDKRTYKSSGYTIGLGLEKRRGNNRVQGIYGAEIYGFYSGGSSYNYEYANAFSQINQFPSYTFWSNLTDLPAPADGYRIKSQNLSDSYGFGVALFVGAEYFFAPKMSLGGEFTFGFDYTKYGAENITFESFDPINDAVIEYSIKGEGTRSFGIDNYSMGGEINLNIYF